MNTIHWVISAALPSAMASFVRWASGLTSTFGWQFTGEIHNLWVALILSHVCGIWATFWKTAVTSGSCMAATTSGSPRISLSSGMPAIPACLFHSRNAPRRATWKQDKFSFWLSSGFSLPLGSLRFFLSLLNPSHAFFDHSLLTFLLILSLTFCNFLGPWLSFLQHCSSIFIMIQFSCNGKTMDDSSWPRNLCAFPGHLSGRAESGFISTALS